MWDLRDTGNNYKQLVNHRPWNHGLAKEAIKHVVDVTWRNEIPLCIYDIIKRDECSPLL
jgi:hypothetical protein